MKLFVAFIALIAGHLVTAGDPSDLAFNGHIQKGGKLIPGKQSNKMISQHFPNFFFKWPQCAQSTIYLSLHLINVRFIR